MSPRFKKLFKDAYIGAAAASVSGTVLKGFDWYYWPLAALFAVPVAALIAGVAVLFPPETQ